MTDKLPTYQYDAKQVQPFLVIVKRRIGIMVNVTKGLGKG
jgi:hypothetical protein